MKKSFKKIRLTKHGFDYETLKHWKKSSTRAKLEWLADAMEFAHKGRGKKI